ncbi:hypothetical protein GFY24_36640 [Nocardia sp. SYP-A9097]|uniref:TY-Chap domain-containing protein n=1 Tax=Nocardia sp. SYP-A9097 TaxID=2663237 RepID=UPI00129AB92D|nr:hypothetical protein [Nocardia sp. SYP-A9097]MRH92886.1 hypothetical protein [Nocardia sp. SYP-A9097]
MNDWSDFTDRLAEQLTMLPDGAVVTISGAGPSTSYVQSQVVQLSDALWATFQGKPKPGDEFASADPELMTAAGWQPPETGDHGTSWWIELPWPVASPIYRQLAIMIVTGFRDGHQIPDPSGLSYDAWNSNMNDRPVDLPLLGIPAREQQ